jgi:diguanylate cyclase (GGDEF)-like protein
VVVQAGVQYGKHDADGNTGSGGLSDHRLHTRTGEEIMHTGNDVGTEQYLDMDNQPEPESAVQTNDAETEKPAINELLAAAEEFNAAFNTALYELEASRKLAKERSARIEELNASILTINTALRDAASEARRKDEVHARESETLNEAIRELESGRERLRQQINEQQQALDAQAGEIAGLTSRVAELSASLEQHKSDSLRAAEAFAREREESSNALSVLQEKYDVGRGQLEVLHADLENRTNELAGFAGQVDALTAELVSLTDAGTRREAVHREESSRLHSELQALNDAIQVKEDLLQQSVQELDARNSVIATLNERTAELEDGLEAQAGRLREETESHARDCEELNDRISSLSGDHESLKHVHDELAAHVEKLENLNRALNDSSNSEQDVHRKIVAEKDAAITALRAKLEAMKSGQAIPAVTTETEGELKAAMTDLKSRLEESESQVRLYAQQAGMADELEAQVEQLKRELQTLRESGATTVMPTQYPAQEPAAVPAPFFTDRDRYIAHLNQLLAEPGDSVTGHILMYILLDNFIRVRDEIGVLNSEQVIDGIFEIISSCCDSSDMIARFGDCTFAVLCKDTNTEAMQEKAEQIRSTVEKHIFEVAGHTLVTSTSIGICAVRGSDSGAEQVISRADLACESARLSGGNQVVVSSAVPDELCVPGNNTRHAEIVDKVLAEDRIKIYYQPISSLKENSITCFEVLTRVIDENSDMILPGEFFTMAANSGKATEVDRHVIESVLESLAEKPDPDMKFFIKLTRQSVSSSDLPAWISDKLEAYNINPGQLVFEVAEKVMDSELKNLSRLSMGLNKIGCKLAIEHYRLETKPQHLHHIHPDYLKIDSGLVQNIGNKGGCLAKVNEVMDLARLNNLITIAEGVENPASLAMLWELGVSFAQGYFISEPTGKTNFELFEIESEEDKANDGKAVYTIG